jgi:hypothetical protein
MKNPTKSVEIPPAMQEMADQSMQQAKKVFDMYIAGVRQAFGAFGDNTPMASTGGKELGERALKFAERNIELSFAFAGRFMQAKDFQELMKLQVEYWTAEMQLLMEQATDLSHGRDNVFMDLFKPQRE